MAFHQIVFYFIILCMTQPTLAAWDDINPDQESGDIIYQVELFKSRLQNARLNVRLRVSAGRVLQNYYRTQRNGNGLAEVTRIISTLMPSLPEPALSPRSSDESGPAEMIAFRQPKRYIIAVPPKTQRRD